MSVTDLRFVDISIPGLSGRDFARKAAAAIQTTLGGVGQASADAHRDYLIRSDLSSLDRSRLRDLGLDRNAM